MAAIVDTRLHHTLLTLSNKMEIEGKLLEYLQGKISFNEWLEGAASRERHTLMPGPSVSLGIGYDQAPGLASGVSRPSTLLRPMSSRNDSDPRNNPHRMMQDLHVKEGLRNFDGDSNSSDIVRERIEEMVAYDDDADEEAENDVNLADIEGRSHEESNEEEMMTGRPIINVFISSYQQNPKQGRLCLPSDRV